MALVANVKLSDCRINELHELEREIDRLLLQRELAMVDRPMRISELMQIFGLSDKGLYGWDKRIKSGVRLSFVYDFVRSEKPKYLPMIERYIRIAVKKKLNLVEFNNDKHTKRTRSKSLLRA